MKCPYCKNQIPNGSNACPICGKFIIDMNKEKKKIYKSSSKVTEEEITNYKRKSLPFSFEGVLGALWLITLVLFIIGIFIKVIIGF